LYKNKTTRALLEKAKIEMALGLPPDRQDLLSLPESIESITASINISGGSLLKLSFEGKDSSSAEKLFVIAKRGENELKQFYVQIQQAPPSQQPPGFAMMKGIIDPLIAAFSVNKDAQNVILELKKPVGLEQVLAPILAAAFSQAQVAASRSVTRNKLKQVGLAFLNYEETYGCFPPANKAELFASDGQPKLSWRVHLLPFLDDGHQLYKKFKLDEPWDSPNNKPLINEMPDVYRLDDVLDSGGKTRLVVLVGPGTPFHNLKQRGPNYAEFTDGSSNTLLALEVGADKAIEWTKPESDNFDPNNPLAALGDIPPSFNVLFADGRVMTLSSDRLLAKTLKAIATHQGKERFAPNELREAGPSDSGGSLPPRSGGSLPPSSADPEPPPPVSNSPQKGK
jgi:prepilin-type processing-associated H-X9-DG protein